MASHQTRNVPATTSAGLGLTLAIACALATAVALFSGCAAQQRPVEQFSDEAVVLSVPVVEQDALYECGLASISVLCEFYEAELTPEQRAELARIADEREGLSGAELRAALERSGLEVFVFPGSLDRSETGLFRHVDAGRPLLVMTSPGGETRHYVLFLGYDEPRDSVCLLDPMQGRVLATRAAFERSWERCQRFTLLALPGENTL